MGQCGREVQGHSTPRAGFIYSPSSSPKLTLVCAQVGNFPQETAVKGILACCHNGVVCASSLLIYSSPQHAAPPDFAHTQTRTPARRQLSPRHVCARASQLLPIHPPPFPGSRAAAAAGGKGAAAEVSIHSPEYEWSTYAAEVRTHTHNQLYYRSSKGRHPASMWGWRGQAQRKNPGGLGSGMISPRAPGRPGRPAVDRRRAGRRRAERRGDVGSVRAVGALSWGPRPPRRRAAGRWGDVRSWPGGDPGGVLAAAAAAAAAAGPAERPFPQEQEGGLSDDVCVRLPVCGCVRVWRERLGAFEYMFFRRWSMMKEI